MLEGEEDVEPGSGKKAECWDAIRREAGRLVCEDVLMLER
jgi:hypothetical protein